MPCAHNDELFTQQQYIISLLYTLNKLMNVMNFHKLTAFDMLPLWTAQTVLMYKFLLLYSSLIFFQYSLTAVCVSIFCNDWESVPKWQQTKLQNLFGAQNFLYSSGIAQLKMLDTTKDIPNNKQINGCLLNSNFFA